MILESKVIKTIEDFVDLDIIDWNKLNNYWKNPLSAMNSIGGWMTANGAGGFQVSRIRLDEWENFSYESALEWNHRSTSHVLVGRQYWNWFMGTRLDAKDWIEL